MSAPTALDAGALVTGLAWRVRPPTLRDEAEDSAYTGDEQRSRALIAQLTREHNELCTQAVDAFEIAAGLEAEGLNDRQARSVYGAASVFELAQAMYDLVPRRPAAVEEPLDPWYRPVHRHLLHGVLYALPGLMYVVALAMLGSGFNALVLIGTTIVAAGLSQGLSLLGHVLIGRGQKDAANALFRTTLIVAGVLGGAVMLGGWFAESVSSSVILAGWQVTYLLAATILMVMNAGVLLLTVLAPGVTLAVLELTGAAVVPRNATLAVLTLCVAAAGVAAWFRVAGTPKQTRTYLRERFTLLRFDVAISSSYFVYGIATAGLVAFAVVDAMTRGGNVAAGSIALMMLPLVASLGVAEWQVYRLRSRAVTVLRETSSLRDFRIHARSQFARSVLLFGGVLVGLTVATCVAFPQRDQEVFVANTCAYSELGLAFFGTTLLLSLRRHRLALAFAITTLVVDSSLRWVLMSAAPGTIAAMHLLVFAVFLVVVLPTVSSQYTSAGAHR